MGRGARLRGSGMIQGEEGAASRVSVGTAARLRWGRGCVAVGGALPTAGRAKTVSVHRLPTFLAVGPWAGHLN